MSSLSLIAAFLLSAGTMPPESSPEAAVPPATAPAEMSDVPAGTTLPEEPGKPSARTVVTSTRVPRLTFAQPRAMSVASREDLSRRPARTTPEVLHEQEGVFLQKTNQGGGAPIVRGLYGQQLLLLVDGVRLNNATVRAGPNQYLNTVDPFLVEQLEVLRGPGSVLYGSDALGGVVNAITFWPRFASEATPSAELRAQASSADLSLQGHARAGISLANTAVAGAITTRDFNDLRGGALVGLQPYTGYEEGDAALKIRQRLAPGSQLYLQYQAVRQANAPRLDRSRPGDFRRFTRQERDLLHARLAQQRVGPLKEVEVELSVHRQLEQMDRFRVTRDRLDRENVEDWTTGLRLEAEAEPTLGPLGMLSLVFGGDAFYDRVPNFFARSSLSGPTTFTLRPQDSRYPGTPTALATGLFGLLSSDERKDFSYHVGLRGQLNQIGLPEDARLNQLFTLPVFPATTERALGFAAEVGIQQRIHPAVALLLNLGSGFRAPNVDDYLRMGEEGPGYLIPSRGLRPEQSYTAEAGVRMATGAVTAQAFYAYTTIPGLVGNVPTTVDGQTRTPDNLPYLTRQNRDSAQLHAVEGAVSWRVVPQVVLAAHATYTSTRQRRKDLTAPGEPLIVEPLSRTPPPNGLLRVTWEPNEALFAEGVFRWALPQYNLSESDRLDIRICPEAPDCRGTPGYAVAHVRAGARLGKQLSAALTLQNVLDATYRNHGSGVDEPGRSVVLSLEGSL